MFRLILNALLGLGLVAGGATFASAMCPSQFARSGGEKIAYCRESTVPESIVVRARAFLASSTNPSYQQTQYELVPDLTGVQRSTDCHGVAVAYQLTFEYAALRRVNAESSRISFFFPVDPDCPATGFVAVRAADGTIVEPQVSREQAIEASHHDSGHVPADWLLTHATVLPRPETPVAGWQWDVYFREPSKGDCFRTRDVVVDGKTGRVLASTESTTCY